MSCKNDILKNAIFRFKRLIISIMEPFGKRYRYISIFDYVLQSPKNAKFLSLSLEDSWYTVAKCYRPDGKYDTEAHELKNGISLFDWLALVNDAVCFKDSDLVLTSNGYALNDAKDYKSISYYGDYSYGLVRDNAKFCQIKRKKKVYIEEAFFLDGMWSWNWYHFVTQVLPKMKFLSMIPREVPILVSKQLAMENNFQAIFRVFLEKHDALDRQIIYLSDGRAYSVKRLYVASAQGLVIPDLNKNTTNVVRPEWALYKKSTISFIRKTLLSVMDSAKTYPQHIYITRRNASGRRRFNEEEIVAFVESAGYTVVAPEEYSIQEQVALFNNAKNIIACSGAALTNLIYCQPGCKIIIMNNYQSQIGIFNTIASLVCANSISISGYDYAMQKGDDSQDAFTIEPDKVKNAIQQMDMII